MAGARRLENEIRVGLEEPVAVVGVKQEAAVMVKPLDVISFGKSARQHVREFGALFATICFSIAAWKIYRGDDLVRGLLWMVPGAVFWILGVFAPSLLLPVWRGWMKLAHYLSIVMTAVVLSVTWCLGFLPMALILRLTGVKRIDRSFGVGRESYWETRDPKYDDFKRLKLQY